MTTPIIIVQGAQFGSEAKGAIAAYLCQSRNIKYAVRTGAINAGHTVYYKGKPYKMQQLPTGWVNPDTQLVLGPGAMIHAPTLMSEIMTIDEAMGNDDKTSVLRRLWIDNRCGVHGDDHTDRATAANRHHLIGATGKGCSEAIIDKIRRRGDPAYGLFRDTLTASYGLHANMHDTTNLLYRAYQEGDSILLEGTQGSHLDLHLGPYPYTTHKPCQAAQWVVEAGLPPGWDYEVILVARTYPIRVAGNSGPLPREIDWVDLAVGINSRLIGLNLPKLVDEGALRAFANATVHVANKMGAPNWRVSRWTDEERVTHRTTLSEMHREALALLSSATVAEVSKFFEMTTVTKKLRRIAEFDVETVRQSVRWNNPSSIALTFANYWYPELNGYDRNWTSTDATFEQQRALVELGRRLDGLATDLNVPISMVSFGPESRHVIEQ